MTTRDPVGRTTFSVPSDREIVAIRVFAAPRRVVWEACTSPEHLTRWMLGPPGWTMPVCEVDLRPGGAWHHLWRRDDGVEMEMSGEYRRIVAPERLVSTERWGDAWPEAMHTVVLEEEEGETILVATVLYPSREARDAALATGMAEGWSASYDRLDRYLPVIAERRGGERATRPESRPATS